MNSLHAVVSFQRYLNSDLEVAEENFPDQTPTEQMRQQFLSELAAYFRQGRLFGELVYPAGSEQHPDEDYRYLLFFQNYTGEGDAGGKSKLVREGDSLVQRFVLNLQHAYDEHGMSGFYEILTIIGDDGKVVPKEEIKEAFEVETKRDLGVVVSACGQCDHYHVHGYDGECRDDSQRYGSAEDAATRLNVPVREAYLNAEGEVDGYSEQIQPGTEW